MVNKVILVGNVGIDPEVRTTESGVKVARIRLATTERLFDRQANEAKEHTEWHTVTLWRGLADVVDKYVRKGTQIYVEGRLRTRECRSEGFGKNGLSNQSRKSKITPARVYSDRGEIVKIRLVRQPLSCHSIMCRTVLPPARITRVRRKVPGLVG